MSCEVREDAASNCCFVVGDLVIEWSSESVECPKGEGGVKVCEKDSLRCERLADKWSEYVSANGTIEPTIEDIEEVWSVVICLSYATEGLSTVGTNAAGDSPGVGKTPSL